MRIALLAFAVTGSMFAASAQAATSPQTGNLTVSATVASSCLVVGPNALDFGAYDPADAHNTTDLDGSGTITVRCTRGSNALITLGQGANAATGSNCTTPLRQMASGATERLRYFLYSDTLDTVWGCDTSNDVPFVATNSSAATAINVYGTIPAGQNVAVGSYTDTVLVSITF
jgi:spore coat protein U-like protein